MRRQDGHQGIVIGLTHTEIMLIFAVVILLLWVIKEGDLKEEIESLETQLTEEQKATPELLEEANMAREVIEMLTLKGELPEDDKSPVAVRKAVLAAIEELIDYKKEVDAEMSLLGADILEALAAKGHITTAGKSPEQLREEVKTLLKKYQHDSERMQAVSEALGESVAAAPAQAGEGRRARDIVREVQENATIREEIEKALPAGQGMAAAELIEKIREFSAAARVRYGGGKQAKVLALKEEIGFIPCWLADASTERKYYFSYDIFYDAGAQSFQIKPSGDWNVPDDSVQKAVNGGMPSLKQYPAGAVQRDKLRDFGVRLNEEKIKLYGEECRLVTHINEKGVDGTVVKFIRDKVHLYPIYK